MLEHCSEISHLVALFIADIGLIARILYVKNSKEILMGHTTKMKISPTFCIKKHKAWRCNDAQSFCCLGLGEKKNESLY